MMMRFYNGAMAIAPYKFYADKGDRIFKITIFQINKKYFKQKICDDKSS